MPKIYFVRHGECELNAQKVFAGQLESPLTEEGRDQAKRAADDITAKGLTIDCMVSSPLERAAETAKIVAETIGFPVERIIKNELFIERDFGALEGTSREEFFNAYSYQDVDSAPRAETLEQLQLRAGEAYEFLQGLQAQHILVVSHSGFYRALRRAVTGDQFSHEYTNPFLAVKNGVVYSLNPE